MRNDVVNTSSIARSRQTTEDAENPAARAVSASCSAAVVRVDLCRIHNNQLNTPAAASDVRPSTMNSSGNDTSARNPPTAGPMLIPRLIARRLSAIAAFRWSAGAELVSADIVAG